MMRAFSFTLITAGTVLATLGGMELLKAYGFVAKPNPALIYILCKPPGIPA